MLLPNIDLTTPGDASRQLGIPRHKIYHAIERGRLKAIRVGHNLLVNPDEVKAALPIDKRRRA